MSDAGEYSDVEYVFEANSTAIPDVREYIESVWERRQFMLELARADLRSLRTSTALGNIWGVLDPLFQSAIYFFLYIVLRGGGAKQAAFLPILIGGFFLLSLSMAALGEGGASIKRAKGLLLNSTFPRAILPITAVYKALRNFVPSAAVFAIIFPLMGGQIGTGLFLLPLVFVLQTIMNVGISLMVSTYVTLVPDGSNVMSYVTRVLFFATPVVYPVSLLRNAKVLVSWQPLFPLFASYQAILSGGVPSLSYLIQTALWAFALLAIGVRVFLRHEREFAMAL